MSYSSEKELLTFEWTDASVSALGRMGLTWVVTLGGSTGSRTLVRGRQQQEDQ